jgi:negative regulator of flagellin synthesis FlgM
MKINNSVVSGQGGKPAVTSASGGTAERGTAASAKTSAGASSGASVQLSALSTQLAALEASLASGPAFDANKVEEIKQAIRDGTLTVDARVVAEKMLAGLQEMFAKVKA